MTTTTQPAKSRGPLLDHLDEIEARSEAGEISLQDIVNIFGAEGHYVFILFLILPFLQPIPLFGLSTPFGLLIALIALFAYQKKPPYIPKRWAYKKLSGKTVLKIAEGSERIFEKIEFLLHPRLSMMFNGPFRLTNTSLMIINAILLALPLPIPFSNAFPAWTILLLTLAHLEKDGVFIILSYIQTLACFVFFALIGFGIKVGLGSF